MPEELPASFSWDDKTEVTKAPQPKIDDFRASLGNIREALKKRPTLQGYLTLIGELLDRMLLDEAKEVADEFHKWEESEKQK